MERRVVGKVKRVNGPVITLKEVHDAQMMEMVRIGEQQLVGEVIKLFDDEATVQVYEDATGICPGDNVYGSGSSLSCELGPGLIGSIYDGIQRPLEKLMEASGAFIGRGLSFPAIDHGKKWHFVPSVKVGDPVHAGSIVGSVQETERVSHKIMVPPEKQAGTVSAVVPEGDYTVEETVVTYTEGDGREVHVSLSQRWPIRAPRPVQERLPLKQPLITGLRVIDTLFPLPKGGTVAIPGGFGTGKTMTQHSIAQWCDADIIVYIGCGERGNEMTDVLREFPQLVDPRTGKSLMERTILIANTSNMPVSAREASIYTGVTMAEYYRDMGYQVAIMADSTSRWAEALREMSGRLEEMPGEEGYPAYLGTRLASFYERAGRAICLGGDGREGSVSVIGAVSPPGGDLSEPVTQNTLRVTKVFWGLDANLAYQRHFPAINWLNSYSLYTKKLDEYWDAKFDAEWTPARVEAMTLLEEESSLKEIVQLVGMDALSRNERMTMETAKSLREDFLHQNAFSDVDTYTSMEKQFRMLSTILKFHHAGLEALQSGAEMNKLFNLPVREKIARMGLVGEQELEKIDALEGEMRDEIAQLLASGGDK